MGPRTELTGATQVQEAVAPPAAPTGREPVVPPVPSEDLAPARPRADRQQLNGSVLTDPQPSTRPRVFIAPQAETATIARPVPDRNASAAQVRMLAQSADAGQPAATRLDHALTAGTRTDPASAVALFVTGGPARAHIDGDGQANNGQTRDGGSSAGTKVRPAGEAVPAEAGGVGGRGAEPPRRTGGGGRSGEGGQPGENGQPGESDKPRNPARERVEKVYDYFRQRGDEGAIRALEEIEAHRLRMFELTREEQAQAKKPDAFKHPALQKKTSLSQDKTMREYFESSLIADTELDIVRQKMRAVLEEPLATGDHSNPIHRQITNRIRGVVAELPLDTLLPSENELMELFGGISRNTVRTVIQQLSSEGLVDKRPGIGSIVTQRREEETGRQPDNLRTKQGKILFVMHTLIAEGELVPGDKLPTEEQMMGQFDVKRNTIREVMRKLREEKLVWSYAGKGTFVIDPVSFSEAERLPFNEQIANSLRTGIATGVYLVGDKFPSEQELADEWGVGLNTVKNALAKLRDENLIFTWAGKGSFVINAETFSEEDRLPLHEQIKQAIKLGIESGVFQPGHDIPSIPVWREGFGVGANTVLTAIHELADEGVLIERMGGLPYIVAQPTTQGERQAPIPPPYQQTANELRTRLAGNRRGEELPSREELARELGVSRNTVDKALRIVETEGLVLIRGEGRRAMATGGQPISLEERLTPSAKIELNLRTQIAAKEFRPGDRIPTETELAKIWGVDINHVRKAIGALKQSGLIATRPGGLGTFVV